MSLMLLQQFKEKVLSDEVQFELQGERKKKIQFVKYNVGEAVYVFGDYSYFEEFSLDKKLTIQAILSGGKIFIVDTFTFDIYSIEEETYPKNVFKFSTKVKELNSIIQNKLFPKYYSSLPIRELTEDEQSYVRQKVRKTILQEGSIVADYSMGEIITAEVAGKLLRGELNLEKYAGEHFEKEKDFLITRKSENHELKKLVDLKHGVEEWEIELANALRELDAKNVTVEFNFKGEVASEKVVKTTLLWKLYENGYFSSYDFVNGKSGEALLKKLNAGTYWNDEKGTLKCEHIQSVKYGRKEIYSVLQLN